jgi:6-phosphogluconate dehydrogenase (decarboxylating)
MAHDGPTGLAWPRFQITGQADTYSEVVDLINKVRIALDGFTGTMGGAGGVTIEGSFVKDVHDGYEFATERETRRLDVVIWHQE